MHSDFGYRRQKRRKKRIPVALFILLIPAVSAVYVLWSKGTDAAGIISPLPDAAKPVTAALTKVFDTDRGSPDALQSEIRAVADPIWKNYSVLVVRLDGSFRMDISGNVIYTAASVNKIPILAALYYSARQGDIDLDRTVTLQKQDIQDYGTGSIRYDPPGTTYSLKTLARLMIKQSDNTASYILGSEVIGLTNIQSLIGRWGLTQTDMTANKTSNHDQEILMKKIYDGQIADRAETLEMLSFLSDTDFEDRIPAGVPDSVPVYHKIGTEVGVLHDVGVVEMPGKPYYIGIMTSDISDDAKTTETMARISKLVYDYLK